MTIEDYNIKKGEARKELLVFREKCKGASD